MLRDILQSDLLNESKDLFSVDTSSALLEEEDAESDLLLYFLSSLKEEKMKQASKLEAELACLKADIEKAERRHLSRAQLYSDSTKFLSNRIGSSSMNENTLSHIQQLQSHSKSNKYGQRLMKNIDQLENAYFSQISKIDTTGPITSIHSDRGVLKNSNRYSLIQNDAEEANDCLGTFFNDLCKYARYSKFEVCGSLKKVDTFNSANVICSLSFDRDGDYFATAGVSKKIKIFEFGALLNDNLDVHYPLVEMSSRSKLSCVCWNTYINSYLASTDYEGVVQVCILIISHLLLHLLRNVLAILLFYLNLITNGYKILLSYPCYNFVLPFLETISCKIIFHRFGMHNSGGYL